MKIVIVGPEFRASNASHEVRPCTCCPNYLLVNYLTEKLAEKGYETLLIGRDQFVNDDNLKNVKWLIFTDSLLIGHASYPKHWVLTKLRHQVGKAVYREPRFYRELYMQCIAAGLEDRVVLWPLEPPAVRPGNWDPKIHALFPTIFTYASHLIDGKKYYRVMHPQISRIPTEPIMPFHRKKLLTFTQSNKYSRHFSELYSARLSAIRYFEKYYPEGFDFYGFNWNTPVTCWQKLLPALVDFHPSYRGTIPEQCKQDVYSQYRFGLIYENCIFSGWISEKIFDCMFADCVPVYWGAPDITDFIPPSAFVDRRKFHSNGDLAEYLMSMTESEYRSIRNAIREYLYSKLFKDIFSFEACVNAILSGLGI